MNIKIKNNTLIEKSWGGRIYEATTEYDIEEVDRLRLVSDPIFMADLYAGDAVVSDAEYPLSLRIALGALQNNQVVLNEYYTLIQDDGVLTGNGQILHLHDDLWNLDEENIEDDSPTEN